MSLRTSFLEFYACNKIRQIRGLADRNKHLHDEEGFVHHLNDIVLSPKSAITPGQMFEVAKALSASLEFKHFVKKQLGFDFVSRVRDTASYYVETATMRGGTYLDWWNTEVEVITRNYTTINIEVVSDVH